MKRTQLSPVYDVDSPNTPSSLQIGRQGEKNHLVLRFNIKPWRALWPNGAIGVRFYFHPEDKYLPVSGVYIISDILHIPVSAGMTYTAGESTLIIALSDYSTSGSPAQGVEKRSLSITTNTKESGEVPTEVPDMMQDWISAAETKLHDIDEAIWEIDIVLENINDELSGVRAVHQDVINLHDDTERLYTDMEHLHMEAMDAVERAEYSADRFDGTELEVNVNNGTIELWLVGLEPSLDIELNGNYLEVYGV